jgi:aminoglycoside phosphotransferase (APT) family kinase protein
VFGKVACDDRGALGRAALEALRAPMAAAGWRVPRPLGYEPGLRLLLLEAIPGTPVIGALLESRLRTAGGVAETRTDDLESAIEACARMLASVHRCALAAGPVRDAPAELANLDCDVAALAALAPTLAARLEGALRKAGARLAATPALPLGFAHGDFSHSQVIADGDRVGVLDFDTVCRAEPGLDLGHFVAYLRLAACRTAGDAAAVEGVIGDLRDRFVSAYVSASGSGAAAEPTLRARIAPYETLSLVRLAAHSWRKFKPARLARVLTLLEE